MDKRVKLAFTGVACLSPAYDGNQDVGPLRAILPSSPRARFGSNDKTQVDAHFTFAAFPLIHLVQDEPNVRLADHTVINVKKKAMGLCLFDREELTVDPLPSGKIRYDTSGPSTGIPKPGFTNVLWIPRWNDFAKGRNAKFRAEVGTKELDFVGFEVPAGEVSAGFVCPLTPKVLFRNGTEAARYYAHQIVVTLHYDESVEHFILRSAPFEAIVETGDRGHGKRARSRPTMTNQLVTPPRDLKFTWGTADQIDITIGNGSLASIDSVINESCGHEHRGKIDYEFEVIYDAVSVNGDQTKRPVPEVKSSEIRQIPCIATMI